MTTNEIEELNNNPLLAYGTQVVKEGGDYTFEGIIVSVFRKWRKNSFRVVVENKDGILHIFNPSQLRKL